MLDGRKVLFFSINIVVDFTLQAYHLSLKPWLFQEPDYYDSDTYSNEETTVGQLYSAFTTAASQFYGPLWKTLNSGRSAYDLSSRAYISSDALGYNMDCGTDGINPAYNIDRND